MMDIATFRDAVREYREATGVTGDFCCRVSREDWNALGRCFEDTRVQVDEAVARGGIDFGFVALEIDGVVLTKGKGDIETHILNDAGTIAAIPEPTHPANARLLDMLRGWGSPRDASKISKYHQVARLIGEAREIADGDTKGIAKFMFDKVLYAVLDGRFE